MSQGQNDRLSTEESVVAFLSQLDKAASSRDLDRYMKRFSPQVDVLLAYNGQIYKGVEAIAASHKRSWSQNMNRYSLPLVNPEVVFRICFNSHLPIA